MRAQTTQFFQSKVVVPLELDSDLAEYSIQSVPMLLGALETRKLRSFYASDADTKEAVEQITKLQKELMMGAKRDLIIELRDLRGDYYGTITEKDPDIVAIGQYAGASLNDMLLTMREIPATDTVDEHLTAIRDKIQEYLDGQVDPVTGETVLGILVKIFGALA